MVDFEKISSKITANKNQVTNWSFQNKFNIIDLKSKEEIETHIQ